MTFYLNATILIIFFPISGFGFQVATTIPPLYSLLTEITKGVLDPILLPTSGSDPHHYQLAPSTARVLKESDIVFYISEEFEIFIKKDLAVNAIELLPLMPNVMTNASKQKDVHIWLDPNNNREIIKVMTEALSIRDEENKKQYAENATILIKRINTCEQEIKKLLQDLPNKKYFAVHDAYEYFTHYFNIPSPVKLASNHALSLREIQKLEKLAKEGLACIILDPNHPLNLPEKILTSTKLVIINPLGGNYPDLLFTIANNFLECLTY